MIVKICGITDVEETEYLNENNVDMAGMVLYFPKSKRNITLEKAKEIMASLNENIKKVAVVVSPSIEQVEKALKMQALTLCRFIKTCRMVCLMKH